MEAQKEKIKRLIAKSKLKEAASDLILLTKVDYGDYYNDAILISQSLYSFLDKEIKGTSNWKEYNQTESMIANRILKLVDELHQEVV